MISEQFQLLNEYQQMELIWERGILLAERECTRFRYILYQVNELYVEEVRYVKWNVWYCFRCYERLDELQPYLETIDITSVIKD